ncbi:MAG: hypothetical protein JEZ08_01780 [Clostridiales bacterium]|nr:hypothetical protein [Clostridiales bacterium]
MRKLKKTLSLLMVLVMMLSVFSSCSSNNEGNNTGENVEAVENVAEEVAEEVEAAPTEVEEFGSGDVKWSEETTDYGHTLVHNEGGKTIGYSSDSSVQLIQVEGFAFKDLNQNDLLDPYEDWRLDVTTRAKDLASQLSVESISGLMLYSGHQFMISDELSEEQIAFLDAGGRAVLNAASGANTKTGAEWNNAMQAYVESDGIGIPVNTSSDPRDAGVSGIPSNLALAATFDAELVEEMGKITSEEYRLIGIGTLLGPQIDVTTEPRWNRTDGTFGVDPALSRDLTSAFVNGVQSTFDENGQDLGWGASSMNAMIKHWPGDGAGEGGREGHIFRGNAQVYPGGQFETQMIPFVDGGFDLQGSTESATAVMSSYSIAYDEDETYGELVGTAYSDYKVKDLLREQYGYDGVVCTDWGVLDNFEGFFQGKAYGVFDLTIEERVLTAIMAGVDQFGGYNDREPIVGAYELGVDLHGEDVMRARYEETAVRVLKNVFTIGLFENPYIDVDYAVETVMNEENQAKTFEAQLKSVVMLKNSNNAIQAKTSEEKPKVYVPMVYIPHTVSYFGVETKAEWKLPVGIDLLSEYFEVVTDTASETLTGLADSEGNAMASVEDITRLSASELKAVDFALSIINDPVNTGDYFRGFGFDYANEEYIPISMQYGPYTADSEFVRKESLSGDIVETEKDGGYGTQIVESKENRSYFGKDSIILNSEDLNGVIYASENMSDDQPVIVAVKADGGMIFSELEPYADAIIMGFGMSVGSGYGLDEEAFLQVVAGEFEPSGLLPVQMPADMLTVEAQLEDVPRDMTCYTDAEGNTYDFAYGLNWSGMIQDERTEKYDVEPLRVPSK